MDELSGPPAKRQRVARACANCRRKKARCNGLQPCEPCGISNLICTYEDGGRLTSTEYIKSLEKKVGDLETLLNLSLDQPWSSSASQHCDGGDTSGQDSGDDLIDTIIDHDEESIDGSSTNEDRSQRSVDPSLNPAELGGLSLLRRMHKLCNHFSRLHHDSGHNLPDDELSSSFDLAPPESDAPISWEAFALLPQRKTVDQAIEVVLREACWNMMFLDREQLTAVADEIYRDLEAEEPVHARKPLALIYAVMALGRLFHPLEQRPTGHKAKTALRGLRYFRAARALLDPASCQDLTSIQTLLCMILYTNGASMLSTCYAYICMAVAAALQMGLCTATLDSDRADAPLQQKIFSVLALCDSYVTLALGLPRTLRDLDPKRSLPFAGQPTDLWSPLYGTYMHAQLIQILATTVETNHPFTRPIGAKNGFYGVEYSKIAATEERLGSWFKQLQANEPTGDAVEDADIMRSQLMLRFYHAHVQMVLYRPFLHHALRHRHGTYTCLKAVACGSACIKAAMQAVWLAERLEASSLFNAALWHVPLAMTFAAACLGLFAASNREMVALAGTDDGVRRVRELCARHAGQNESLRRCLQFLQSIPIDGPSVDDSLDEELYNAFVRNTTTFLDASHTTERLHSEQRHEEGVLEALSLPQLQSLLNGRF